MNQDNITSRVFSPLTGFLNAKDYCRVVDDMHLTSGSPWTIPVTIDCPKEDVDSIKGSKRVLLEFEGCIVAELYPEDIFEVNYKKDIKKVFGTDDVRHPGVLKEISRSKFRIGGEVKLKGSKPTISKEEHELTPKETKKIFKSNGWKTIVGFQTRNPIHRAHEYLQRVGLEMTDGLFVQPLLGWKKNGDFSPQAVVASYQKMVKDFYPKNRVLFGSLNTAMRYAGPREAVFHALIRKNFGCTHFIVGRDHAGVGSYYKKYEAHELCSKFSDLGIEILKFCGPFFCKKCDSIATEKTCSHKNVDRIQISGTEIREMIGNRKFPPAEYMRKEISDVLIKLQKKKGVFCE